MSALIIKDYNSNITRVKDELRVLEQMSALYTMDNLNRVVTADQGVLVESSGNYTVDDDWRWRKETWTLSQTGNWLAHNVGTNSAANNALVETGTFNTANEWTGRSRTVPGTASDTLVYDKVGNMVNDGKGLAYKYDGLGRLREVRLTGESNRLKTAYRYNGLGMRITHAINMSAGNSDDDVTDSGDPVTYFAYDERWRVAGAWISDANTTPTSSTPTERWIHHAAGLVGRGGSSYIDSVVLRDRDVVTSGGSASSTSDGGTDALEERVYVLQNWRADVVATVGRTGTLIEWMQYTANGSAITNPPGNADFNGDGGVDGADIETFFLAYEAALLSADVNNDGSVNGDDIEAFFGFHDAGQVPMAGVCIFTAIRVGYTGYQWDGSVNVGREYTGGTAGLYHVRHRVYEPEIGRWTRRDPIGYVDGMGLYEYVLGSPIVNVDATGLLTGVLSGNPPARLPIMPAIIQIGKELRNRARNVTLWSDELGNALLDHYLDGDGEDLDLSNNQNIVDIYKSDGEVSKQLSLLRNFLRAQVYDAAKDLGGQLKCCVPNQPQHIRLLKEISKDQAIKSNTQPRPVFRFPAPTFASGMFIVGGHFLYLEATCDIVVRCANIRDYGYKPFTFHCDINFRMKDKFEDPLTFLPGGFTYDPGDPFTYTLGWAESLYGIGNAGTFDGSRCNAMD